MAMEPSEVLKCGPCAHGGWNELLALLLPCRIRVCENESMRT